MAEKAGSTVKCRLILATLSGLKVDPGQLVAALFA
jgi:hypothetical protein